MRRRLKTTNIKLQGHLTLLTETKPIRTDRPALLVGRPKDLEDARELVQVRLSRQEGHAQQQLGQDAAHRPHVHARAVLTGTEQKLRGPTRSKVK